MSGPQANLYTQADLDFFSANADEYFAMANALRSERDTLRQALEQIVSPRSGHLSRDALRGIAQEALDATA